MRWETLKARLLAGGTARLEGEPCDEYVSSSTAGPGAGGKGSIFFSSGGKRVRLALDPGSEVTVRHLGGGKAVLDLDGQKVRGRLDMIALHCPGQAFITVSSGCIFSCRYCEVPRLPQRRKTAEEILSMVEGVMDRARCISLTSGVMGSVEEEEQYVLSVVERLSGIGLPIGVSIYPLEGTPGRLRALGVAEVKFNVEAATGELFSRMCPGLSWEGIWKSLEESVTLFSKNHVHSNLIIGLGETDREAEACIRRLTGIGVIPVVRPLNPVAGLSGYARPSSARLLRMYEIQADALRDAGLDPARALTMCAACTGCDLTPGRDDG